MTAPIKREQLMIYGTLSCISLLIYIFKELAHYLISSFLENISYFKISIFTISAAKFHATLTIIPASVKDYFLASGNTD